MSPAHEVAVGYPCFVSIGVLDLQLSLLRTFSHHAEGVPMMLMVEPLPPAFLHSAA